MKFLATLSVLTLVSALSHTIVSGHDVKLMKRHQHLARSSKRVTVSHSREKRAGPSRMNMKRKVPGEGDSTTAPDNLAEGTATTGCAVWHTVLDGEVCLGLIDKSSSGFTLAKFLQMNPSLNDQCSNLETGLAYCVDTVVGKGASKAQLAKVEEPATTPASAPRVAAVSSSTSDDDNEDLEDCEDEADSSSSTDNSSDSEEEDCEEEDDSSTTLNSSNDQSSNDTPAAAPKPQAKVKASSTSSAEESQQTQEQQSSDNNSGGDSSSSDSSNADLNQSGIATWYQQNGQPGNCGNYMQDSDFIVALYTPQYENGANCGKKVKLVNTANGNTVEATVQDSCPSCETNGNIDCSVAVFNALSDNNPGLGVLNVKWGYV